MKTSDPQAASQRQQQSTEAYQPQPSSVVKSNQQRDNFWLVFSSTFITIFLAEMGDKTQLVTLLMSAESQSPWIVFIGAALALIATSLIGVSIGYWLAKKLSPETLDRAVAILLLIITAWLVSDVLSLA